MSATVRLLACLLACCALTANAAVDSYICVVDAMTGFSLDKATKRWEVTNFRAEQKFLITRSKKPKVAWEVNEVGSSRPDAACERDFNESGNLFCTGFAEYRFNRDQLRFLYIHAFGYWSDDNKSDLFKEGMNMPALAIGKCSPL